MSPLAQLLREAINAAIERDPSLSQAEIARRAGLYPAALSRALSGTRTDRQRREISEQLFLAVCEVLELEVVLVPRAVAPAVRTLVAGGVQARNG